MRRKGCVVGNLHFKQDFIHVQTIAKAKGERKKSLECASKYPTSSDSDCSYIPVRISEKIDGTVAVHYRERERERERKKEKKGGERGDA